MALKEWVSFNQNMRDAEKEIELLEKEGYVVVDSYGDDYDMGNIYEFALGEDREDVLKRHRQHISICESQRKFRESNIFQR